MKNRYLATLLLLLPFIVAMAPAFADSTRTIDVALSHIKTWLVVTMSE
jgi:predicted S18 family serine protease